MPIHQSLIDWKKKRIRCGLFARHTGGRTELSFCAKHATVPLFTPAQPFENWTSLRAQSAHQFKDVRGSSSRGADESS